MFFRCCHWPQEVTCNYNQLQFTDLSLPGLITEDTICKVIISGSLQDIYRQTLGKDQIFEFKISCNPFRCNISAYQVNSSSYGLLIYSQTNFVTFDPFCDKKLYTLRTYNNKELRVILYKLDPLTDIKKWKLSPWESKRKVKSDTVDYLGFGEVVFDKILPVEGFQKDKEQDFHINLDPALVKGIGQVGHTFLQFQDILGWSNCSSFTQGILPKCVATETHHRSMDTGDSTGSLFKSLVHSNRSWCFWRNQQSTCVDNRYGQRAFTRRSETDIASTRWITKEEIK